jgi:CTP synthase
MLAIRYAREQQLPYLGLCLGMQLMVIETARGCAGMETANSTEFDPETPYPVIDLMPEQRNVQNMGGTMRLGLYPCDLMEDSGARQAYGVSHISERHRHRFELNNEFREVLEGAGLRFSGLSPDRRLVEIAEVVDHPFMVGTQFHPEFLSRPNRPHPLFRAFVDFARNVVREGGQPSLPWEADGLSR